MDIERLKELKLAVCVVFQHWLYTAANQKGVDNTESKKFFKKDAEYIHDLIDEAIARQSVKSEEVQEAIEWATEELNDSIRYQHNYKAGCLDTIITALQAYQPEPPKGE